MSASEPTPVLARGYTDPTEYMTDLLYTAYGDFPHGAYCFEGTAEDDAADIVARGRIPETQRFIADDPKANIPAWMRPALRGMAEGVAP